MKTISWHKNEILHIETTIGIVNILPGLNDRLGRRVVSIEVIPDRYYGELKVVRRGYCNTRLIELKTKKEGR
jgi:hypothetical protein